MAQRQKVIISANPSQFTSLSIIRVSEGGKRKLGYESTAWSKLKLWSSYKTKWLLEYKLRKI